MSPLIHVSGAVPIYTSTAPINDLTATSLSSVATFMVPSFPILDLAVGGRQTVHRKASFIMVCRDFEYLKPGGAPRLISSVRHASRGRQLPFRALNCCDSVSPMPRPRPAKGTCRYRRHKALAGAEGTKTLCAQAPSRRMPNNPQPKAHRTRRHPRRNQTKNCH
jgi:hypothetical protein